MYVVKRIFYKTDLVGCRNCNRYWGMNHDVRAFLPFTYDLYEMYKSFGIKNLEKYITRDRKLSMFRG